jgi:hypothetical protein
MADDDTRDWLDGRPVLRLVIAAAVVGLVVVLSGAYPLPWWGPQ